jgi:hypothetical protein
MWLSNPMITAEDQAPAVAAVRLGLRAWQTGPVTSPPALSGLSWNVENRDWWEPLKGQGQSAARSPASNLVGAFAHGGGPAG